MSAFLETLARERVFVVARGEEGAQFLDLQSVSFTVEGAADLADARDGQASQEWRQRNRPAFVVAFDLVPVAPLREIEIPATPARRYRRGSR